MATYESLQQAIEQECRRREGFSASNLRPLIEQGEGQTALENLLFFTSPQQFPAYVETLQAELAAKFSRVEPLMQEHYLRFLAELTLSLRSFLPNWNLRDIDRYGDNALTEAQLETLAAQSQTLLSNVAGRVPAIAGKLLAAWRVDAVARLKAESAADPEGEAAALVGHSIDQYLTNLTAEIARSNLGRIAHMRHAGQTLTELSNDYAAFLPYTLYLGVSFVTCNPPLVDLAWVGQPERWNPVVDSLITAHPAADEDTLAQLVTTEIVLANMRLLRPIFLLTTGRMGCVCLQVNPHLHADAAAMITAAQAIYERLQVKLDGGVPNVLFKLPGTQAGLEACRALTGQGIGVTITVNFGMFQHLPFAEAIQAGQAIFSCLVEMNGRLAYPVRDELLSKMDLDEASAREAAAWAGVAVIKRLHRLLLAHGYDLSRIKPLIASLRIYEGDGYEQLPSAFPDITEIVGVSLLSVFPNVRRAFDTRSNIELAPRRIEQPVPAEILARLTHSEIFKQAYYVADRQWLPADDSRFRPDHELTLADEAATAAWLPVHNTLTEFINSYDTFVQRIRERKNLLRDSKI